MSTSPVSLLCTGLLLVLPFLHALEPTTMSDKDAHSEHPYLRRQPKCSGKRSGDSVVDYPSKVLHQIWWQGKSDLPAHFEPLRASWAEHHPTWQHKLWDAESITALVNSEAYSWFAPTFHALPSKIQQVDAARYVILHAEGGVYADLDVEAFQPLDEVLDAAETRSSLIFFEEPATHWTAHDTVLSNGLLASPKSHPLLRRLLERGVRPVAEVFKSGGSHMLQAELASCVGEEEEATASVRKGKKRKKASTSASSTTTPCGCYVTKSSELFFPMHEAMRGATEFPHPREQVHAVKALVEDVAAGSWPPKAAYTAQYWTVSWIDPDIGASFVNGLLAARRGATKEAEAMLLSKMWSKWGTKYKYRNHPEPPAVNLAKNAYERSLDYEPKYAFGYYELGNLRLEEAQAADVPSEDKQAALDAAEAHFTHAVALRPDAVLFVNNLGVAKLNNGKPEEALPQFQSVIELQKTAFATVQGLDPEAGAHLNIGHALHQMGQTAEAAQHWMTALRQGSFEYAAQAVQRLHAAKQQELLPSPPSLDMIYGDALARAGRSREAAMRFASAYLGAPKEEGDELTAEGREMRDLANERMTAISEVWDEGEGRPVQPKKRKASDEPKPMPTIVQAAADGSTTVQKLTPEMLAAMQAGQRP